MQSYGANTRGIVLKVLSIVVSAYNEAAGIEKFYEVTGRYARALREKTMSMNLCL